MEELERQNNDFYCKLKYKKNQIKISLEIYKITFNKNLTMNNDLWKLNLILKIKKPIVQILMNSFLRNKITKLGLLKITYK